MTCTSLRLRLRPTWSIQKARATGESLDLGHAEAEREGRLDEIEAEPVRCKAGGTWYAWGTMIAN